MVGNRDLREHLNDLWKTTVDQFDEIKDVILRNSHVGRKKLDTAFLRRQRDRLLQDLGESVYAQVRAGSLDLAPEGQRLVERVTEVLAQIEAEEAEIARLATLGAPLGTGDDEPTQEMRALDADGEVATAAPSTVPADAAAEVSPVASPVDEVPPTGDIEDAVGDPSPRRRRRRHRRSKKAEGDAETGSSDDEN